MTPRNTFFSLLYVHLFSSSITHSLNMYMFFMCICFYCATNSFLSFTFECANGGLDLNLIILGAHVNCKHTFSEFSLRSFG